MRIVLRWLAAMVMLCLPAATDAQPMGELIGSASANPSILFHPSDPLKLKGDK